MHMARGKIGKPMCQKHTSPGEALFHSLLQILPQYSRLFPFALSDSVRLNSFSSIHLPGISPATVFSHV